jgi:hypothetical protein
MSYFMNLSAKGIAYLLFQVAELRVMGKDWEIIAAELKLPVKEMREFLWEHDAELALQIRKARRGRTEYGRSDGGSGPTTHGSGQTEDHGGKPEPLLHQKVQSFFQVAIADEEQTEPE